MKASTVVEGSTAVRRGFTAGPLIGAGLGLAVGLVSAALLQQTGAVAPTQMVVWGCLAAGLALGAAVGGIAATPRRRDPGLWLASLLALALAIVAVAGASSHHQQGHVVGQCSVSTVAGGAGEPLPGRPDPDVPDDPEAPRLPPDPSVAQHPDAISPDETSTTQPFEIEPRGALAWFATSPRGDDWTVTVGVEIAGLRIPVWSGTDPLDDGDGVYGGYLAVGDELEYLEAITGLRVSGLYPVYASLEVDGVEVCDTLVYVLVPPEGIFVGTILLGLWLILAGLLAALAGLGVRGYRRLASGGTD